MKKFFAGSLIILALAYFVFGQTVEEKAVMQAERDIMTAIKKGDGKTLERLFADDLTVIGSRGWVGTKQELLKDIQPGEDLVINFSEMKARVYGSAAVATGVMEWKIKPPGQTEQTVYVRFTDTFVKKKNDWQMVSSQQLEVPVWQVRKLTDAELKPITSVGCQQESSLKSLNSDVGSFLRFTNSTDKPVTLYWINYEGKRDPNKDQQQTLKPGESAVRFTYLTHPFLIADANGKCLGIYQPTREPGIVVIK